MKTPFILFLAVLLGGCASVSNTQQTAVYDFGLPASRLAGDGAWSRLALDVRSPPWFDALHVDYRLAYDDPLKLREYAGSRWASDPGILLAQRLRQHLGMASASSHAASQCLLRVEVQEFSQVFDSPHSSRGVLQGNVSVVDGKRQLLADHTVYIEKAASSADAQGGVSALVAAGNELGQRLADWLAGLEKSGSLVPCRLAGAAGKRNAP